MRYLKKAPPPRLEDVSQVQDTVTEMLAAIENEGDSALHRYSEKLDNWNPPSFRISHDDIRALEKISLPVSWTMRSSLMPRFSASRNCSMTTFMTSNRKRFPASGLAKRVFPLGRLAPMSPEGAIPCCPPPR